MKYWYVVRNRINKPIRILYDDSFCSVDPIMNQLNAAKRTSSDILDSIDKHRRTLEACDSILEEINPAFKQTKDQDRKIKNLEEKVDRMGSSFDELKELLIKKLG